MPVGGRRAAQYPPGADEKGHPTCSPLGSIRIGGARWSAPISPTIAVHSSVRLIGEAADRKPGQAATCAGPLIGAKVLVGNRRPVWRQHLHAIRSAKRLCLDECLHWRPVTTNNYLPLGLSSKSSEWILFGCCPGQISRLSIMTLQ